jgi:TRAP-type mannitol/chloroaromatic compound transport system permease small subunit
LALLRLIDRLSLASACVAAVLVVPLILGTTYEVFSRYVLGNPTIWSFELSYMLMGASFLLGLGYALQIGQHVNVDIFYARFSPGGKAIAYVVGYALFLPVLLWLDVEVIRYTYGAFRSAETTGASSWNPVVWPFRATWSLGLAVFALQAIAELARAIRGLSGRALEGQRP